MLFLTGKTEFSKKDYFIITIATLVLGGIIGIIIYFGIIKQTHKSKIPSQNTNLSNSSSTTSRSLTTFPSSAMINNQQKTEQKEIITADSDETNKLIDITKMVEEDDSFKVFVRTGEDLSLKFRENETVKTLIGSNKEGNIMNITNELNKESDRTKVEYFKLNFFPNTDEINVENKTLLLILWYFYDLRNNEQEKYETYKAIMDSILNWFCMEHYSDGSIKWLHSDESEKKGCLDKFGCADNRRIFYNFFFYYRWFMGRDVAKQISDLLKKDNVI